MRSNGYDMVVIGAGLVGAAVAYGLVRAGQKVAVLDEEDAAYRASRGNFGLVWVQGKGIGCPEYARWSRASSERWFELSAALVEDCGLAPCYARPGGGGCPRSPRTSFSISIRCSQVSGRQPATQATSTRSSTTPVSVSCCRRAGRRSPAAPGRHTTATPTR